MDLKQLLSHVDHTLLSVTATTEDYVRLCDEALAHGVASVCVPPTMVWRTAKLLQRQVKVCTVVGFPCGYTRPRIKVAEARDAIRNGAKEIDMVINISQAKEHSYTEIQREIEEVRSATAGRILKVIIETAVLTDEEKIALCKVVSDSGADYIKTSTGFASGGATFEDVALLRKYVAPEVKVKAAGGINTLEDAFKFIELGADRLGTSRIIKLVQGMEGGAGY
ncbi:MAG: deoxyribose-phosphate aldolase [Defluviitaleaceae bacterium]|nr:deoxyribose-phosphate aldolase [Defluviitaleaceae bacterium]